MQKQRKTKPVTLRTYAADLEWVRNLEKEQSDSKPTEEKSSVPSNILTAAKIKSDKKSTLATPVKEFTIPKPIPKTTESIPTIQKLNNTQQSPKPLKVEPEVSIPKPKTIKEFSKELPTKIPAFREIQNAHPRQKNTPLGKGDFDATIIRETKKTSRNPLKKIVAVIAGWFKKDTRQSTQTKTDIPATSNKNSSKAVAKLTENTETLRDRIQSHQAITKAAPEPETFWTPQTEPGFDLLTAPDTPPQPQTTNVTVERKRFTNTTDTTTVADVTPVEPAHEPVFEQTTNAPVLVEENQPQPTPVVAPTPTYVAPATPPAPQNPEPPQTNTTLASNTHTAVSSSPAQAISPSQKLGQFKRLHNTDTNTLTLQIMGGFVSLFAVVVASILLFNNFMTTNTAVEPVITQYKPIITNAQLTPITLLAADIDHVPAILASSTRQAAGGVNEYIVVGQDTVAVSPSYLFSLLSFETMASFRQSISQVHFVTINSSRPSLLLKHTDIESAQGGLLNWERTMAEDMRALYELPPTTQTRFTDQRINGLDTRILAEDGNTILMYAFLDENTIVITPSRADFTQIQDLYQHD